MLDVRELSLQYLQRHASFNCKSKFSNHIRCIISNDLSTKKKTIFFTRNKFHETICRVKRKCTTICSKWEFPCFHIISFIFCLLFV